LATRRREPKKKSNNGIWVGTAISMGIIVLISLALYFKFKPAPADSQSGAITEANLAKQTFKAEGLPKLGDAPGGSGSFADLLTTIGGAKNVMSAGGFEEEKKAKATEVCAALHGAAASSISEGFLDAGIDPKRFESAELRSDLGVLGKAVRLQVKAHLDDVEFDQAQAIALSYLKLGQQAFEKNIRLKSRQRGFAMMKSALSTLGQVNRARYDDGEIKQDKLTELNNQVMKWNNAIKTVEDVWNSKLKSTESVNQPKGIPNIGDLIQIAKEDKDRSFRIWAARRLGYALFERGDKGNQEAINAAIEELKADSDKLVAKAAEAGQSIADSDEYYELRK